MRCMVPTIPPDKLKQLQASVKRYITENFDADAGDLKARLMLDFCLRADPASRVACESLVTTGLVIVAGEITCDAWVDIPSVVRRTVTEVGYTDAKFGLTSDVAAAAWGARRCDQLALGGGIRARDVREHQVAGPIVGCTSRSTHGGRGR